MFKKLLMKSCVIREPVHGDIWLTELEKEIIDHPLFQRLRRIKQLGPTDMVYPGAIHTRFLHSLGVMHISQKIIDTVNKNYERSEISEKKDCMQGISNEDTFVIRIVALMHDLAHVSWGHTLEDEGNLSIPQLSVKDLNLDFPNYEEGIALWEELIVDPTNPIVKMNAIAKEKKKGKSQWLNEQRAKCIFIHLFPIIRKALQGADLGTLWKIIINRIGATLIAEEIGEEGIKELEKPYIADIVGNTICADLIDYLKRDSYFTGLRMEEDSRILDFFVLWELNSKLRLAICVERRKDQIRNDILNSCIQLLRMRFSLAQKVYHHRVKRIFSAIAIKMVYCALKAEKITERDLLQYGDDIIPYLIKEQVQKIITPTEYEYAALLLSKAFIGRQLYKIVYKKDFNEDPVRDDIEEAYADPDRRYELERIIELLLNLDPGCIIVYSPKLDKGKDALVKILRGVVRSSPRLDSLKEMRDGIIKDELDIITKSHQHLWNFLILIEESKSVAIPDRIIEPVCASLLNKDKNWKPLVDVRNKYGFQGKIDARTSDEACAILEAQPVEYHPGRTRPEDFIRTIDEAIKKAQARSSSTASATDS